MRLGHWLTATAPLASVPATPRLCTGRQRPKRLCVQLQQSMCMGRPRQDGRYTAHWIGKPCVSWVSSADRAVLPYVCASCPVGSNGGCHPCRRTCRCMDWVKNAVHAAERTALEFYAGDGCPLSCAAQQLPGAGRSLAVKGPTPAGTVVFSDQPYVSVINKQLRKTVRCTAAICTADVLQNNLVPSDDVRHLSAFCTH